MHCMRPVVRSRPGLRRVRPAALAAAGIVAAAAAAAAGTGVAEEPASGYFPLVSANAAADVFVMPACERSEAFGVVQVEALASGTPIVSTELGTGTSYVNQEGVTGRVVPAGDAAALGGALRALLADPAQRHAMAAAARQRAAAEFSLPVMVTRVEALYRSL